MPPPPRPLNLQNMLDYLIGHKDFLLLFCFTVDALNTMISFPLIIYNGPKWVLRSTEPTAKEKLENGDDNLEIVDLSDTERKSFRVLWEIFTICYEGYFGFTVSTLLCMWRAPETRPLFAYSLFALYLYKAKSYLTIFQRDSVQGKAKLMSILLFYWPCYGGYCLLHLIEYGRAKHALASVV